MEQKGPEIITNEFNGEIKVFLTNGSRVSRYLYRIMNLVSYLTQKTNLRWIT